MATTNRIETTLDAINAKLEFAVLVSKKPLHSYDETGKKSEAATGTKLTVALPGNRFEPLGIKFEGTDPLPKVTDEMIGEACERCTPLYVRLTDCKVVIYSGSSGMGMTATAKAAELVTIGSNK